MTDSNLAKLRALLARCNEEQRRLVFNELRATIQIHKLEETFGASAEVILEAIHRASDLTRWMLRGVVAEAGFAKYVVPTLAERGWRDVTPPENTACDYVLADAQGKIGIQVKLQRSTLKGGKIVTNGRKWGLAPDMYLVELQRSRTGVRPNDNSVDAELQKTRPYRFGEFDVLAVSLQPSTGQWSTFRYTVGDWLLAGTRPEEIATYQPVAMKENADWTDDIETAISWFRSGTRKTISNEGAPQSATRSRKISADGK